MPDRQPPANIGWYVAVIAGLIGFIGYTVFGWRFGESDGAVPLALGIVFAVIAVGWTLFKRN